MLILLNLSGCRTFFLLWLTTLFVLTACKKNNIEVCELSHDNLAGSYQLVSISYKETPSSSTIDYIAQYYEECEKDDVITFQQDNVYSYADFGEICAPNGSYDGHWSLERNVLISDGIGGSIRNFSCSGFSVIFSDIPGEEFIATYAKQ